MKRRVRIVLIVGLILSLFVSSVAFASTNGIYPSNAQIYVGSTYAEGAVQSLSSTVINGYVSSNSYYSQGNVNERMTGMIKTRGLIFIHTRDSVEVSPGGYANLYWGNPNEETGTFWSVASAPNANHYGNCYIYQNR